MGLTTCPKCGGTISEKATVCPHCNSNTYDNNTVNSYEKMRLYLD